MSHTPHELADEFPKQADKIHELKSNNTHFSKLADDHHTLNREIHRIETNIEPASDEVLENLKKKRLAILDEVTSF
ncbi:MAG: DUF465 domain-containing protein [Rickettsiales bacterium]|nr:DUF465 domain-containing protein [Rickettsiales bacterium]